MKFIYDLPLLKVLFIVNNGATIRDSTSQTNERSEYLIETC
jgi:hypothetical protein